jgi:hypothetical protein
MTIQPVSLFQLLSKLPKAILFAVSPVGRVIDTGRLFMDGGVMRPSFSPQHFIEPSLSIAQAELTATDTIL